MKKNSDKNYVSSFKYGDFLYDCDGFIQWSVNIQGKSLTTSKSYLSLIRTAFIGGFDLKIENPFENVHRAFIGAKFGKQEAFDKLEFQFKSLKGYKQLIEEFGIDVITDEGEWKELPTDGILAAFKMYIKYIRYKIDRRRQAFGLPISVSDDKEMFIDLPLSKEFRQYLRNKGKGYTTSSINSIACKLRRIYNLFLRRRLKRDFMPDLEVYIMEGHSLKLVLEKIEALMDYDKEGALAPEMSEEDFTRGKVAFSLYREFIEDYSMYSEKYCSEKYTPNIKK